MKASLKPFPWAKVMEFGFGVLRHAPADFWSMSVREIEAAMRAYYGRPEEAVTRDWLTAALSAHPDVPARKDEV